MDQLRETCTTTPDALRHTRYTQYSLLIARDVRHARGYCLLTGHRPTYCTIKNTCSGTCGSTFLTHAPSDTSKSTKQQSEKEIYKICASCKNVKWLQHDRSVEVVVVILKSELLFNCIAEYVCHRQTRIRFMFI